MYVSASFRVLVLQSYVTIHTVAPCRFAHLSSSWNTVFTLSRHVSTTSGETLSAASLIPVGVVVWCFTVNFHVFRITSPISTGRSVISFICYVTLNDLSPKCLVRGISCSICKLITAIYMYILLSPHWLPSLQIPLLNGGTKVQTLSASVMYNTYMYIYTAYADKCVSVRGSIQKSGKGFE